MSKEILNRAAELIDSIEEDGVELSIHHKMWIAKALTMENQYAQNEYVANNQKLGVQK